MGTRPSLLAGQISYLRVLMNSVALHEICKMAEMISEHTCILSWRRHQLMSTCT